MHTGKGQIVELILENGLRFARIACAADLIPAAGQYLLASDASDSPLPVPLFYTDSSPEGFICAPPVAESWKPGQKLYLRGPLGHGFTLPLTVKRIALIALDGQPWRLRGLIKPLLKQGGLIVLVSDSSVDTLSDEVEVQPLSSLSEVVQSADYIAFDVAREDLLGLKKKLDGLKQVAALTEAQVLIRAPMPCAGVAECGVCAVSLKSGWELICKEGPVFVYNGLFD